MNYSSAAPIRKNCALHSSAKLSNAAKLRKAEQG